VRRIKGFQPPVSTALYTPPWPSACAGCSRYHSFPRSIHLKDQLCAALPLLCTLPEGRTNPAAAKCVEAAWFDLDYVVQSATRSKALQVSQAEPRTCSTQSRGAME
jgi:hypothetical protein